MAMKEILKKMFGVRDEEYDEYGRKIRRLSMEEKLLETHMERERRKMIRAKLQHLEKKHDQEIMPFRLKKPKGKNKYWYGR